MTDEMNEDPVAESKQFDHKVSDFTWGGHQNRVMVRWLMCLVTVVLILVGLVVIQAFSAARTATEAKGSELSTYQSCLNRNVQDVDQIGLWRYVIELTGSHKLGTLQKYINSIFAERQCINAPPAATVEYDYHRISQYVMVPGMVQTVTDRKCVPVNVKVFASIVWTEVSPHHIILPEKTKTETLNAGCSVHTHKDAIPADVVAVAQAAFASGMRSTVWRISGTEIPSPSNMNVTTWETPEFKIVP